MDNIPIY